MTLAAADLRSRWVRGLALVLAIAVGCAVLTLIATAALSIRRVIVQDVIEAFPANEISVQQKQLSLFYFKIGNFAAPLGAAAKERIEAIEGVVESRPELLCTFPAVIRVRAFGSDFVTETCIFGVSRPMVACALKPDETFAHAASAEVVPAVISKALLDLFNTGFAPTRGLPKLDESLVLGLEVDLYLGVSTMSSDQTKARKVRVRIVGISPRVSLVGVSVPAGYASEWNAWYHGEEAEPSQYHRLTVSVRSPRDTERVAAAIEAMGYEVSSRKRESERLNDIVRLLDLLVAALSVAVALLTAVGVANAAALNTAERMGWIGLLRACGATRLEVVVLLVGESAVVAAAGGLVGAGLSWLAAEWLAGRAPTGLPAAIDPQAVLAGWWPVALTAAAAVTVLATLASLWPALRGGLMDPADALMER